MRVAIAWYGAEGQSSYRYYESLGYDVTIVTPKVSPDFPLPEGAKSIVGEDAFLKLGDFDVVVRSAHIAPSLIETSGKIWSCTNEFFARCPAPIIGVTGTKGKGTTCSLIASILKSAGKQVHLVGNIGVPPLDVLPSIESTDVVVFELSSFQLWDLEKSPHVAVVLMIEPDHLDVHRDFAEYVGAKSNIRRHQGQDDLCIYHPTNIYSKQIAMADGWPEDEYEQSAFRESARRYAIPDDAMVYVENGNFCVERQIICGADDLQLVGQHNLDNACAAISASRVFTVDNEATGEGLRSFHGLPHRLKFVDEINGVKYYDDSIATTPGSAIASINSFAGPKIIILGGSDKGADFTELVEVIRQTGTRVIAIGQTGRQIADLCRENNVLVKEVDGLMDEVMLAVDQASSAGDTVILSPASASFGQYKNYSDRGNQFVKYVKERKHATSW